MDQPQAGSMTPDEIKTALVEAMAHASKAMRLVEAALVALGTEGAAPPSRAGAAVRTTSTQILAVMSRTLEPMTLIDIADGVVAIRRGEDEPKRGGGTRYQELCRTSLSRLVERGLVRRVPPTVGSQRMRFQRVFGEMVHENARTATAAQHA